MLSKGSLAGEDERLTLVQVFFFLDGVPKSPPSLSPRGGVAMKQALSCASSESTLGSIEALLELFSGRSRMDAGWRPTTGTMADGGVASARSFAAAVDALRRRLRVAAHLSRCRFAALVRVERLGTGLVILATLWLTRWSSPVSWARKSREPKVIWLLRAKVSLPANAE
jgi:hypothetical protein